MNLFGKTRPTTAEQIDHMKAWVRSVFYLNDETTIMVTELACCEPGCPPAETVIAVLEGPGDTRPYKIHKTADEIDLADIEVLVVKGEVYHDWH